MKCLFLQCLLLKKGSLCLVCVYIVTETENPDTHDLPKKVPSRTNSLLKVATFGPQGPPIQPNTSLTVFGWNRNPLLSLHSSVKWFFAMFQNSQKWLIVPIPAKQFGWNRNFWPKMAIFQLLKKEQKSLLNYYTSLKLWFLFQPNTVNEVFGWNRNRYTFIVPIPAKHPVYIYIYVYLYW